MQPFALTRLTLFLIDCKRYSDRRWTTGGTRPLIMCVRNPSRGVYMVLAITCPARVGVSLADERQRNFGQIFERTKMSSARRWAS